MAMPGLSIRDAGGPRHDGAVNQPFVIQGDVIFLFLIIIACGFIWNSSFRHRPQGQVAAEGMQRQLDECPFTIRQVNESTYLIREHDRFVSQSVPTQLPNT